MSRKRTVMLCIGLLSLFALFFVPLRVGPFLDLSLFDFVTGALSGGRWSSARIILALAFGVTVLGLAGAVWQFLRNIRERPN